MRASEILALLPEVRALVVGDICLDRWCLYDPTLAEASRETGLDRIAVVETEYTAGAGGTVANNLVALGVGTVSVLGVIGQDGYGWELSQALGARSISAELCVRTRKVPTFTYTKLLNWSTGREDQPRVDWVHWRAMPRDVEQQLCDNLRAYGSAFDVIFVSDQAELDQGGVVTPLMRGVLRELAAAFPEKVCWVDSRRRPEHFRRLVLKPNEREAEEACQRLWGQTDYQRLLHHTEAPFVMVTRGEQGVLLVEDGQETHLPTRQIGPPVDICGAGDSFSAGAAVALLASRSPAVAARFGNLVAAITITKKGTGTASADEVLHYAPSHQL